MTNAPEVPKKLYDAWVLSQKTQHLEPTNALVFQCALKMYLALKKIEEVNYTIQAQLHAQRAIKAVDTELALHAPIPVYTFDLAEVASPDIVKEVEKVLGEEDGIVVDETGGATDYVGETK